MTALTDWRLSLGLLLLGLGLLGLTYSYITLSPLPVPSGGRRAVSRSRAHAASPSWLRLDAHVRRLAALIDKRLPAPWKAHLDRLLFEAGHPLGLSESEFVVVTVASGALGLALGLLYGRAFEDGYGPALAGASLGLTLPMLRVRALRSARLQEISRALPGAIDLCALCMGAGLDFAAAVQHIVDQAPGPDAPLVEELRHLLRALSLGSTRAAALSQLEQAVPIPSVRDLVAAIRQGEAKGTPLAEVLGVQAQLLRRRRSVAAEEAAARAGILLLLPLLLLMGCILLIIFAPFAVNGFGL